MTGIGLHPPELFVDSAEEPLDGSTADEDALPAGVFFQYRGERVCEGFDVSRDPRAESFGDASDEPLANAFPLSPLEERPDGRYRIHSLPGIGDDFADNRGDAL